MVFVCKRESFSFGLPSNQCIHIPVNGRLVAQAISAGLRIADQSFNAAKCSHEGCTPITSYIVSSGVGTGVGIAFEDEGWAVLP